MHKNKKIYVKYGLNMQKFARKYAKICTKICKICRICRICKICRSPYFACFAYKCTPHSADVVIDD